MTVRTVRSISSYSRIDGVVPGVRGQRAFPTQELGIVDPFVMLDHIGPEKLADDFYVDGHMHPHRGFETLTMMFEGIMYHVDTSGYREELNTGSTQNMVAGSGIQHGGDMAADVDTNVFHEVQLWVNMPAATKMQPPSISSARSGEKPILDRGHYSIEVIAGSVDDYLSPLSTTQPTTVLRVRTSGEGPISIGEISPAWNAMSYALQGSFRVGDRLVEEYETVLFNNDGDTLDLRSIGAGADVLVLAGEPIGEPVAVGGPFVMITNEEIMQAEADFEAGKFDHVTANH